MVKATNSHTDVFRVSAQSTVLATSQQVYAAVSDLPRCGEWSEECRGGEWVDGEPGTVGAVFRGHNFRDDDVVAWAPVVRGGWITHAEVTAAEPGRSFCWAMRDSTGRRQESVWGFDMVPVPSGSQVVHHFRMASPTEGIRKITAEMDDDQKKKFFSEWSAKLEDDMRATVQRIKAVIEQR